MSSSVYSSPISIGTSTTLKFYAKDTAGNIGTVVTQVYTIDTTPPTVSASPVGGTFTITQSVTLAASEPATIYYTKDGTTPTTSSAVYSSPISIGTSTTLKFYAKDTAANIGTVTSQVYTINTTTPPPANNCQNSTIAAVTAIGNDTNIPANARDGNLATRWSNLGVGSWIKLDLGSQQTVCSTDIAWYLGNQRSSNFVISTSTDG